MTDSHAGGDGVGVDYHVGNDALRGERQVFLTVRHSTSALLSMARRKLVANLRHFDSPHFNFHEALILVVGSEDDLIDVALLRMLERSRLVLKRLLFTGLVFDTGRPIVVFKHVVLGGRDRLTNDNVVSNNLVGRTDNSISIELIVSASFKAACLLRVRLTNTFLETLRA